MGQILTEHLDFRIPLSTLRAKKTRKNRPLKAKTMLKYFLKTSKHPYKSPENDFFDAQNCQTRVSP